MRQRSYLMPRATIAVPNLGRVLKRLSGLALGKSRSGLPRRIVPTPLLGLALQEVLAEGGRLAGPAAGLNRGSLGAHLRAPFPPGHGSPQ